MDDRCGHGRPRTSAIVLVLAALLAAGCLGLPEDATASDGDRGPLVVTNDTVLAGETAQLRATARNVRQLHLGGWPNGRRGVLLGRQGDEPFPSDVPAENPWVDFGNVSMTPPPDQTAESFPPRWYWEGAADEVEVRIPVHVQEATPEGRYGVTVYVDRGDGGAVNETVWVTVE